MAYTHDTSSSLAAHNHAKHEYQADPEKVLKLELASTHDTDEESESRYTTPKDRLKHFTFAWYASTMSTGGVAFVLSVIPDHFDGVTTIGKSMFILNISLFTAINITMCSRFIIHRGTFTRAFTNPHEGFFFATYWLTIATIITNTTAYGIPNAGPWLITALRIAFWVYTFFTSILAISYYSLLFSLKKLVWSCSAYHGLIRSRLTPHPDSYQRPPWLGFAYISSNANRYPRRRNC